MTLPTSVKTAAAALLGALFVIFAITATRFYLYPYGNRGSGLAGVAMDLSNYAGDHKGWFPCKDGAPFASLKLLYPYDPSGDLAGVSGDIREARRRIQAGTDLDKGVSSLVYFVGLRDDDDQNLMLFYDNSEGVASTGRRASGHAVGFVGGYVKQIPRSQWPEFLKRQQALRTALTVGRVAPTNTDQLTGTSK